MSRAFFDQIDDELRGLLGPALRNYECVRDSRLIKLWYADPAIHFEVQMVAKRWSPTEGPVLEVGLHLEHADPAANDQCLAALNSGRALWATLLPEARVGPARKQVQTGVEGSNRRRPRAPLPHLRVPSSEQRS